MKEKIYLNLSQGINIEESILNKHNNYLALNPLDNSRATERERLKLATILELIPS